MRVPEWYIEWRARETGERTWDRHWFETYEGAWHHAEVAQIPVAHLFDYRIAGRGPFPTGLCVLCELPCHPAEHFCDPCFERLDSTTPEPYRTILRQNR